MKETFEGYRNEVLEELTVLISELELAHELIEDYEPEKAQDQMEAILGDDMAILNIIKKLV